LQIHHSKSAHDAIVQIVEDLPFLPGIFNLAQL